MAEIVKAMRFLVFWGIVVWSDGQFIFRIAHPTLIENFLGGSVFKTDHLTN